MFDVTGAEFEAKVIQRSHELPVLVGFWAPWCAPCKSLGPTLEQLAKEANGSWELAKLNTDEAPEVSARYGVRGIPNVKLFVNGEPIAEFTGSQPERVVREFLSKHIADELDELARAAARLLANGDIDGAIDQLGQVIAGRPDHGPARLALARIALASGNSDEVEQHLAAIPPLADEAEVANHLREALVFATVCTESGGEQACRERLVASPDDLEATFSLGCCLAAAGHYPDALEQLLEVVATDRRFRDDAARKAMLTIFGLVGIRSELADGFRRRLAIYL